MIHQNLENTHAHVQRDGNEHRLAEEDLEGAREGLFNTLPDGDLLLLKRGPPAVITGFLPQLLCTQHEQAGPMRAGKVSLCRVKIIKLREVLTCMFLAT